MQLTVKTLKGEKFSINAEESSTMAEVKIIIEQEKSELPAASMKLIHSGKVLKDTQTVADCQLKPNAFLVVMLSKAKKKVEKKPAAAPAPAPVVAEAPKTPAPAPAPAATSTPAAAATTSSSETSAPVAVAATPAGAAPASSTPSAPAPPANDVSAESVSNLTAMGFPEAEVRACLRAAGGNADVAVEFLMNGIPDYAQQTAATSAATPAHSSSGLGGAGAGAGQPLAQLRNHPQINQLRTLVQSNPSTLQAVLTQIGQQQPELLQEINGNQELFLQIMNEPVTEDAPAPAPSSSTTGAGSGDGAPAGLPEMMAGLGNPAQMAQMMESMSPEQLQQMAAMMGLTPEQLQMTMQAISRMPPEELQNYMSMAMQGEDMGGMGDMMGGGAGGEGGVGGPTVLRLSEEEMAAVDRLASMGFDRNEAAQAYLACDKNEELAANLLMDGGFGFGDAPDGGGGGGPDGDDMYD